MSKFESKKPFIDAGEGRKWWTMGDLKDLHAVGGEMQNALSHPAFAKSYSESMNLYFLLDENNESVLVNASFYKEDGTEHMIVGPKNAPFDAAYTEDVEALRRVVRNQ